MKAAAYNTFRLFLWFLLVSAGLLLFYPGQLSAYQSALAATSPAHLLNAI